MTTETLAPFDPLAEAIAAADGWPEAAEPTETPATTSRARSRARPRSSPRTS